jgi:hypothetical protein
MANETLGSKIARLYNLKEAAAEMRDQIGRLEFEIINEFDANDQVAYEDTRFKVRIPTKREYDVAKFVSIMGELLTPAQMNEVYSPAHTIEKEVPASVNGTKAKKLYDQGFAKPLERTLLPSKRQLKIETKKDEVAI